MSRFSELPEEFYRKQAALSDQKRRNIIAQAIQESEVLRKIKHERSEKLANAKILFCLWSILDEKLRALEEVRSEHAPKTLYDEWDEEFINALAEIPYLQDVCEDLWYSYCLASKIEDRLDFCDYT